MHAPTSPCFAPRSAIRWRLIRVAFALPILALLPGAGPAPQGPALCATPRVRIDADFPAAGAWRCIVEAPDRVAIVIAPDRPPPLNPSPWYAVRYRITGDAPVTLRLSYLNAGHRYAPKVSADGLSWHLLDPRSVRADKTGVSFVLPAEGQFVAGQEIVDSARHHQWLVALAQRPGAMLRTIGESHDGRPIEALTFGNPRAKRIILLLGRQHPPEVTGAFAMNAFLTALLGDDEEVRAMRAAVRFVAVPLLNPDGVDRGYWRTNMGGIDINRDWGDFSQPETRAVRDLVDALVRDGVRPLVSIDFHSTDRNLFYTQGEGDNAAIYAWSKAWLDRARPHVPDYAFTQEPRNANPGSGTAKNYFFQTYGIPSMTYEVGDETDRKAIATAARAFAIALSPSVIRAR
ncbi:M14 family metallopeptidase [Sphingomonas sp.]|uniref:M14 family metallopeptidase n=1 Tax=Sphingomonas sp. TaxID=28214 RepID=UPI001EB9F7F7|nr:M14 family metallopeptidase [Sphingomonas sp.]MBX3594045.1 succinylglutamate desuccinylase/aspartoacylase family protein [Sphingomonas sp.]